MNHRKSLRTLCYLSLYLISILFILFLVCPSNIKGKSALSQNQYRVRMRNWMSLPHVVTLVNAAVSHVAFESDWVACMCNINGNSIEWLTWKSLFLLCMKRHNSDQNWRKTTNFCCWIHNWVRRWQMEMCSSNLEMYSVTEIDKFGCESSDIIMNQCTYINQTDVYIYLFI